MAGERRVDECEYAARRSDRRWGQNSANAMSEWRRWSGGSRVRGIMEEHDQEVEDGAICEEEELEGEAPVLLMR